VRAVVRACACAYAREAFRLTFVAGVIADEAFVSAQSEEKAKLTEFYQQQAAQAYPVQGSFHPLHIVLAQGITTCASAPDV
jgi:hypothetical protein